MTNKPFDPTKPVQTRDGHKARIICTDAKGQRPIVALVEDPIDGETVCTRHADGKLLNSEPGDLDLINIPTQIHREVWVNVWPNGDVCAHRSKTAADNYAKTVMIERLACIPITIDCEEGEGLSERA